MDSAPHFYAKDRKGWREWLEQNHQDKSGIWLVFDKGKDRTMSWQDIVEEALCFGWIDSHPGKVSETQSKIYVSKRKPKSVWSKINKQHVERLMDQGLMRPAGLKAIEIAKEMAPGMPSTCRIIWCTRPSSRSCLRTMPRQKTTSKTFQTAPKGMLCNGYMRPRPTKRG